MLPYLEQVHGVAAARKRGDQVLHRAIDPTVPRGRDEDRNTEIGVTRPCHS